MPVQKGGLLSLLFLLKPSISKNTVTSFVVYI